MSDFEAKTRAQLAELNEEAATAPLCSRRCPADDKAPCRLCAHYHWLHRRIDDLLDQLQADADLATLKPLDDFAPVFLPSKPAQMFEGGRRWSD